MAKHRFTGSYPINPSIHRILCYESILNSWWILLVALCLKILPVLAKYIPILATYIFLLG
jgi:hypothetical protein